MCGNWSGSMNEIKSPKTLRSRPATQSIGEMLDTASPRKVSAVAGLIAVASFSGAEAQQSNLPPVTIDAPVARPRPPTSRATPDQVRARTALRRAARRTQPTQVAPVPLPNASGFAADRNPYADPSAPYKGDRLQASSKFPEKLLNTPKTVTVLTKEILEDKNATTLKEAARSTAGVTLGAGEGANAFGDRFFIRGFDARNDIFIDGVRDPGVSVRENFFTEQVEILRGPGSSFAGRGTTGGAINIVTKQASTERNFYNMDTTFGTDRTKRVVLDVNQIISPTLAIRAGGLFQDAGIAGRNYVTDNRDGGFVAVNWKPTDTIKVTAGYIHTDLSGLPDFGVPYYRPNPASTAGGPFTDYGVNRNTFYGFVNRDFQKARQDIGSINAEVAITPDLTLSNKFRVQRSILNYVGTTPEDPTLDANLMASLISANPQSRYQVTDVIANQTEATYRFAAAGWRHTAVGGVEVSRERVSIDSYTGLASENFGAGAFAGSGSLENQSVFGPQYTKLPFGTKPTLVGNPLVVPVNTKSVYAIDTANYRDLVILNGGIRYDDYNISATNSAGSNSNHSGLTNYSAGIVVKPAPIASIYAAYATSSNPVGSELDATSATYGGPPAFHAANANQVFGPEKNKAAEVGTKWELFDRHLLLTAALFQTEKENAREVATTNGVADTVVAGAAYRIRGVDLGAGGKITDKWSVFGGLVLMESAVTKSNVASPNPALYPTNVGLQLANVAHQSFNILTKYQFTDVWEVGGQATYRSKIYGGSFLAANQGTSLPDYWRFDAFVEAKIDKNWRAKLFFNNITNKLYYDALYQSAAPFVLVAPGRSVSMVISARF